MNDLAVSAVVQSISLCTGGAGLDLGIELAMPSSRVIAMVEREAFAAARLVDAIEKGLLAPAAVHSNVRTFNGRRFRGYVDGVFGGIPCQPHSLAGKRGGENDERDLWSDTRRIIVQSGAWWVLIENVAGMLSAEPGLDPGAKRVWRDLQRLGFEVEGGLFTASEVGASHPRERLFILGVANPESRRLRRWQPAGGRADATLPPDLAMADAGRDEHAGSGGAGDVLRPAAPSRDQGKPDESRRAPGHEGEDLADADGGRREGTGSAGAQARGGRTAGDPGGQDVDDDIITDVFDYPVHRFCHAHAVCTFPNRCDASRECWLVSNPEQAPAVYDDLTGEWTDVADAGGQRLGVGGAPHDDDRRDAPGDVADGRDAPVADAGGAGHEGHEHEALRGARGRLEGGAAAELRGTLLVDAPGERRGKGRTKSAVRGRRGAAGVADGDVGDAAGVGGQSGLREGGAVDDGPVATDAGGDLVDSVGVGRDGRPGQPERRSLQRVADELAGEGPLFAPGPGNILVWRAILERWPEVEPALRHPVDGLGARVDQLRLLGNGVVPLQAAYAFRTLATELARRSAGAAILVRLMEAA